MIDTGLDDRIVLVTGAGRGIGAAIARPWLPARVQTGWITGQVLQVAGGHAL